MTATETYTQLHRAFVDIGRKERLAPFNVRVLLAIADAGASVRSDVLEAALNTEGSATRRALSALYRSGHARGVGPSGGRRKRGSRTLVSLTESGYRVVNAVHEQQQEAAAAA